MELLRARWALAGGARNAADKFTTICARRVIITRPPIGHFSEKLLEFGSHGVGVCLQHPDGELETLVEPRPWRAKRHSPEAWWFAETSYGHFLAQQSSPAATLSQAS